MSRDALAWRTRGASSPRADPRVSRHVSPRRLALALGLVAAFALQVQQFWAVRLDDAFISYRYADNLFAGHGFTFNPGEWRLGSTAPGHVLLALLLRAIVGHDDLPAAMVVVGTLGWVAQAVLLYALLAPGLGRWPAIAAAVGVLAGAAGSGAFVSMETHVVAALLLSAARAAQRAKPHLAAALLGLAALTRPDALAFAGLVAAWGLATWWRGPPGRSGRWLRLVGPAAVFVAVLLPWVLYAWHSFGSPLPATAAAKYQQTPLAEYADYTMRVGPRCFVDADGVAGLLFTWVLAAFGAASLVRSGAVGALLVAWGVVHALAYLVLRPLTLFSWHLYPVALTFVVSLLVGLGTLAARPRGALTWATRGAMGLLLLATMARTHTTAGRFEASYWGGQRTEVYGHVAAWLRTHIPPGDRVALLEVGMIAYYSDVRVHDLAGLVTARTRTMPRDVTHVVVVTHFPKNFIAGREPVAEFRKGRFGAWIFELRPGSLALPPAAPAAIVP